MFTLKLLYCRTFQWIVFRLLHPDRILPPKDVRLAGNDISVSMEHELKAYRPIDVTESGIWIEGSDEQEENVLSYIALIRSGMIMEASFEQPLKTSCPKYVRPFGRGAVSIRIQFLNALLLMLVTETGIVTLVRFLQSSNAPQAILIGVPGMVYAP